MRMIRNKGFKKRESTCMCKQETFIKNPIEFVELKDLDANTNQLVQTD